jgi:hypothetical protein
LNIGKIEMGVLPCKKALYSIDPLLPLGFFIRTQTLVGQKIIGNKKDW